MTRLRVATWNLAWKRPGGEHGREIADRLTAVAPDIGCWTEAFADSVPGGHVATSQADYGYPIKPGRRKVVLWSRNPWHDIATELPGAPGGRFVRGVTETAAGPVTVVGVCIPWAAAHVSTGCRDRKRWEDHLAFLQALDTMMPAAGPTILLGDFNQTLPRRRQPRAVHDALARVLDGWTVASHGLTHEGAAAIDHIAITPDLTVSTVGVVSPDRAGAAPLSDHFGTFADLVPS